MGILLFPVFSSYASVYPTEVGLEEIFNIWEKREGKTISLFVTPKFIDRFCDFSDPSLCIKNFYDYFRDIINQGEEIIIIFAVGNSDHILEYSGMKFWNQKITWADHTVNEFEKPQRSYTYRPNPGSLTYNDIFLIVNEFKKEAKARGLNAKIFDQLDSGIEFTINDFKMTRHPESMFKDKRGWYWMDITKHLKNDFLNYSAYPNGIPENESVSDFVINQTSNYLRDLGFDGIFLSNAFGTVGMWDPQFARGHSKSEEETIENFFKNLKQNLGEKKIMWMDSYHDITTEYEAWSISQKTYDYMDYISISSWSIIANPAQVLKNLSSKINLSSKVFLTIDFTDPWYIYDSASFFSPALNKELREYIQMLKDKRFIVDGVLISVQDEDGNYPEVKINLYSDSMRRVFYIYGGKKYWIIDPQAFNMYGFKWNNISKNQDSILNIYENGFNLDGEMPLLKNGLLLGDMSSDKIYIIHGGRKYWITSPKAFFAYKLNPNKVMWVSTEIIQLLPAGYNLEGTFPFPQDGLLIGDNTNGKVYLLFNRNIYWIISPAVFNKYNFTWNRIHWVEAISTEVYSQHLTLDEYTILPYNKRDL